MSEINLAQMKREPGNSEAVEKSQVVPLISESVVNAKYYHDNEEHDLVIESLEKPIEVGENSSFLLSSVIPHTTLLLLV